MPTVDPLVLRLQADLAQYNRKVEASTALVDRSLKRQEDAVSRLELQMARSSGAIGAGFKGIAAAAAGVSVIALARQFLSYADAAKQMEAQLRLATQAFGSFSQAQQDAERIAAGSRAGLQDTTALYGSFIRSAQELGKTQGQAAQATETFTKALKIGGAAPQQVASATLQLGQALSSTNVQWEELGQILEASPRLAKVFTDALGVTRGQLKKMAEDGKLSAEQLFDALNKAGITKQIDDEFRTLPVTFSDAMQQVENAAIITFGAFDRGGQFSQALASFVSDGSEGFADLAREAEQTGIQIRATFEGLADAFEPLIDGAASAFATIGGDSRSLAKQIRDDFSNILNGIDAVRNADNALENRIRKAIGAAPNGEGPSGFGARFDAGARDAAVRGNLRRQERATDAIFERLLGRVPKPNQIGDYLAGTGSFAPTRRPTVTNGGGGRKAGPRGPSAETLAKRAEADRQRELRNDEAFANEKAALNQDILRARQSLATAADVIAQYELQEIEATRTRQNTAYQADVAQKRLTQARADELIALNDKVAVERAALVNAREAERKRADAAFVAEGELANSLDLLNAQSQLVDTAKERRAIALRILDAELALEKARLDEVLASRQSTEAEKQRARDRLAALPGIRDAERQNVERQNGGPVDRYRREIQSVGADLGSAFEDIGVGALQELNNGLVDAIANGKSLGDVFSNLASSIISDLARIAVQQLIILPLLNALGGGVFGGGGGFLGGLFGRASGGYVGPGQTVRVNEQRGAGVELLRMGSQGGTVIPLGQANASARQAPTAIYQTFVLDNRGGVTTPQLIDQMNALAQNAAAQGAAGGRALAAQDRANAARPRF